MNATRWSNLVVSGPTEWPTCLELRVNLFKLILFVRLLLLTLLLLLTMSADDPLNLCSVTCKTLPVAHGQCRMGGIEVVLILSPQ